MLSCSLFPLLKWSALGLGLFISSVIVFTGYWTYSDYSVTTLDRVASGQPLTNDKWNTLVDVTNNLSVEIQTLRKKILG